MLSMSLVTNMLYITWFIRSTRVILCGFLIKMHMGVMEESFKNWVKYLLKLTLLSNTTLRLHGYLNNYVWLNIGITLVAYFSMYSLFPLDTLSGSKQGTLKILNQPVVGSIIFMQVRLISFFMIAPPGWCFLIDLEYEHIRYICTEFHSFNAAIILGRILPQIVFLFLNCWNLLHILMEISACDTRHFRYHTCCIVFASLLPLGSLI